MHSHQVSDFMTPLGSSYNIDIVFCVDLNSTMNGEMASMKRTLLDFPGDLVRKFAEKGKTAAQVRARIITFGHGQAGVRHISESPFRTLLPDTNSAEYSQEVLGLTTGGEHAKVTPALEALECAISSNWVRDGDRLRHIIVLMTNSGVNHSRHRSPVVKETRPQAEALVLDELAHGWESSLSRNGRRLLLFAPESHPWPAIGDTWEKTIYLPNKTIELIGQSEFETLLDVCVNAV